MCVLHINKKSNEQCKIKKNIEIKKEGWIWNIDNIVYKRLVWILKFLSFKDGVCIEASSDGTETTYDMLQRLL